MVEISHFIEKYSYDRFLWFLEAVNGGMDHNLIASTLGVSPGRVSQWKRIFFSKRYYIRREVARVVTTTLDIRLRHYSETGDSIRAAQEPTLEELISDPNSNNWDIQRKHGLSLLQIRLLRKNPEIIKHFQDPK